jgi:nucleoside-diphosphate-sugar epimerase
VGTLTLADRHFSPAALQGLAGAVSCAAGDVSDPEFLRRLVRPDTSAIFHLAAMVSGQGEEDFEGCLRINLDATRQLLEICRTSGHVPRLVLASSVAVFGGHSMSAVVSDTTKPLPQTTYGATKLIGELLVNEYSRKGYVDGRSARLPTVFIRPGKPNAAASSFASGLFREPLDGKPCYLPVPRHFEIPLLGYRRVVDNLIKLVAIDAAALGSDRAVTLPSTRYRIQDLIASLQRVADAKNLKLGPIVDRLDPNIVKIVEGWPVGTDASRIAALKFESDQSVEQVIEEYIADFLSSKSVP